MALLPVQAQAQAEAELGVVLEERIGPGGPAAVAVARVGRGRQVAAVDGGAARGVGDDRAVAEELGEQLDVGRLAAAGAGAGEFEERIEELGALHLVELEGRAVGRGEASGRTRNSAAPRHAAAAAAAMLMAFFARIGLALDRAELHAELAAGAILGRDLQRVAHALDVGGAEVGRRGSRPARRPGPRGRNTSRGWRRAGRSRRTCCTGCRARCPTRGSRRRDCASPSGRCRSARCRRAGRRSPGARSPRPESMTAVTLRMKSGASSGTGGGRRSVEVAPARDGHLAEGLEGAVHGGGVLLHHLLALLAVGFLDGFLDAFEGLRAAAARG